MRAHTQKQSEWSRSVFVFSRSGSRLLNVGCPADHSIRQVEQGIVRRPFAMYKRCLLGSPRYGVVLQAQEHVPPAEAGQGYQEAAEEHPR